MRAKNFDFRKQQHKLNFLEKQMSLALDYRNHHTFPIQYQQLSIQLINIIIQCLNELTQYISDEFYNKVDQIANEFRKSSKAFKNYLFRQSVLTYEKDNMCLQNFIEQDEINQFLIRRKNFELKIQNKSKYIEPEKKKQEILSEISTYCSQFKSPKRANNYLYKSDVACGSDLIFYDQCTQTAENPMKKFEHQLQIEYLYSRKKSVKQRNSSHQNKHKMRNSLNVSPLKKLHTIQAQVPLNCFQFTPKTSKRKQSASNLNLFITSKVSPKIDSNLKKYVKQNLKWHSIKMNQKGRFSLGNTIKQRMQKLPTVFEHT